MTAGAVDVVPGRSCDACTLCCKVIGVPELTKPRGHDCNHCETGRGCRIYARRPSVCADFYCSYLLSPALGDEWKPLTSHLVLGYMADADVILVYTDPDHPDAWRREPYLARIKKWAATADKGYVLIWEEDRALALLNDDEFDLGKLYDGQVIVRDAGAAGKATIYAADRPGS